jgi:hypothetical protein
MQINDSDQVTMRFELKMRLSWTFAMKSDLAKAGFSSSQHVYQTGLPPRQSEIFLPRSRTHIYVPSPSIARTSGAEPIVSKYQRLKG